MENPLTQPFRTILLLLALYISSRSLYTILTTELTGPALRTEWAICTADLLVLGWILCREWTAVDRDDAEVELPAFSGPADGWRHEQQRREVCRYCACCTERHHLKPGADAGEADESAPLLSGREASDMV
ncbi:hypothetical protein PUNSTDRAFT_42823 [Punctularia strigosozonata HHB-11173 SS5]|uniref:uncharacterized protein n=1 Tax=Punctularia strigosozonata (strain HHB-11173) TaxID=741275 RepID=UPI000441772C|nr:uncharacterized protein PUNSTDRAFT_42823 [Punctularia strigosozonata HHB-11173 SS5]EIN11620.1 hypothetical protein PUNSTDRAFT_42823 [Punctularia strigosozonata HHB-11173 SS5]